jgi:hypothetical protein
METLGAIIMSDVNEFNAETNQYLIREYNEQEIDQRQIDLSNIPEIDSTPVPDNEKLISAINKLKSLGLTEDEARAIAGIGA